MRQPQRMAQTQTCQDRIQARRTAPETGMAAMQFQTFRPGTIWSYCPIIPTNYDKKYRRQKEGIEVPFSCAPERKAGTRQMPYHRGNTINGLINRPNVPP